MKNYIILFIGFGLLTIGAISAYFTNIFDIQNTTQINSLYTIDKKITPEKTQNINFTLYFDFGCPSCQDFFTNTYLPLESEYKSKNINFSVLPYSQKTVGKSFTLAKYLTCMQKTNKSKTNNFIQNIKITDNIKDNKLFSEKIKKLELSEKENSDFFTCIKDEKKIVEKEALEIRKLARKKGVIGTPTFFINDIKFERNQNYLKVSTILENILTKTL